MTEASGLKRLRQRISARFARPHVLWLQEDGQVRALEKTAVEPWGQWLSDHPGSAVELIVPAALQHQLVCEPGLPLDEDAALTAYARQQFSHYFGAAAQRWAMAPWRSGQHRGAVALHGVDGEVLQSASKTARVELRAIRPAWAAALAWAFAEQRAWALLAHSAFAWVEGPLLTWIRLEQGECVELRHLRLQEASVSALRQALKGLPTAQNSTLLLGFGLAGDASDMKDLCWQVHLAGATPDPSWLAVESMPAGNSLPTPDFVDRGMRRSRLAWPFALIGALAFCVAVWDAQGSYQAWQEAQVREAKLSAAAAGIKKPSPKATAQDAARWLAAGNAKLVRDYGWEATLADVERVADSGEVAWLALDVQPARSDLLLEGLAKDKGAAIRSAQALEALPGWTSVLIRQVQAGEAGQQRFEMAAKLKSEALRPPAVLGVQR